MNEEQPVQQTPPNETPKEVPPQEVRHISHSYQDDLSRAMNATDATTVQEMLADARARETYEVTEKKDRLERKWYVVVSFIFFSIACIVVTYGLWKYTHLTVPVVEPATVGVFPSTDTIVTTKDITATIKTLEADTTLKVNTPYLVPIVSDTQIPITTRDFFSYIQASADEPFIDMFTTIRLGVMNNGDTVVPFLIGSIKDPVVAAKELLIAEPNLLKMITHALDIDTSVLPAEIGSTFRQEYRYNLPVRILSYISQSGASTPIFFYGFATDTTIVITTDPAVLKAVSDMSIRQQ